MINLLIIFSIFSIVGWVIELIYRSVTLKKFVNPGFMTGCVVPLYGIGAVILYLINSLTSNISLFILCSIVLLTGLELITGILLKKIFKLRLWDYRDRKFNYNGYICLEFTFYWLIFALIFRYTVYPWIGNLCVNFMSNKICMFILGLYYGIFVIDLCASINLTNNIKKYALSISKTIDLEKFRIDIRKKINKNKFLNAIYPYFSTNIFVKDKIKDDNNDL